MEEPRHKIAWLVRLLHKNDGFLDLHEIMFSANIAAALTCACLVYLSKNESLWTPANDATYYFLRSAYRVNDFLHLRSTDVISTKFGARQLPARLDQLGDELLILLTTFAFAALVLLSLRLISRSATYRVLLSRVGGITALFAAPVSYLFVLKLTWTWVSEPPFRTLSGFWENPMLAVFGGEILCLIILLGAKRRRSIPLSIFVILAVVHYAFWTGVLWPLVRISIYPLYAPYIFIMVFPLAGMAWLLYLKAQRVDATKPTDQGRAGTGTIITAIVAVAVLFLLWLPTKETDLAKSKELDSLTIQMSRGACRGPCPIYTVTIRGDGSVEYLGERNVRVAGVQRGAVSPGAVAQVLQILDRTHFSGLEDRAFTWCFDTDSVAVSVSLGGRTKRVVSDASCSGARFGMQASFVKSSSEIDAIVGSKQWVSCDGPCWK